MSEVGAGRSLGDQQLIDLLYREVDRLEDDNAGVQLACDRLREQNRELSTICAVLAYLNGRDVGLGSFQVCLPIDVAFEVRQNLPAHPSVLIEHTDGALVITVV